MKTEQGKEDFFTYEPICLQKGRVSSVSKQVDENF